MPHIENARSDGVLTDAAGRGGPALRRLADAYRRTGADLPFGDHGRRHGTALEGYYWRLVDPGAGRVVVALCGVCRPPGEPWALVALAGHPGGFLRYASITPAGGDAERFGARAGSVLAGNAERLTLRLDDDAWIDVRLVPRGSRPGRAYGALGPAHAVPGLPQYWQPMVLSADVRGEARLGGAAFRLDGASAYAEKNWGAAFPDRWWWGHAGAFGGADVGVAFAGGIVTVGPARGAATAVVVQMGDDVIRLAPPLAFVRAEATADSWRINARSARHAVEIEGDGGGIPHLLPVPDVAERRVRMRSVHHLAGSMAVRVRRGRSLALAADSDLAGLEVGLPQPISEPPPVARPRSGPPRR